MSVHHIKRNNLSMSSPRDKTTSRTITLSVSVQPLITEQDRHPRDATSSTTCAPNPRFHLLLSPSRAASSRHLKRWLPLQQLHGVGLESL
ncbi:hypothetical protein RRG08_055761 [Elysia crispata]|uniref:Uncharacterized protein n=1 Tax=Elysia crispata TaxID=231223 RepID=A0AAE1DVG9_9GAST|nr:hypothetical protein RRG08_055761 [Elysia crispata]